MSQSRGRDALAAGEEELTMGAGRALLKDQAYREIKRRILDGHFSSGSFLAERWLAHELGMSKTPIRAAIGRLESEGFVAVSPQQGIVVREMSVREVVDHFETRLALESYVARQLAGAISDESRKVIEANLTAQRKRAEAGEVSGYLELDRAFHLRLCEELGNGEISHVIARQCERLHRVVYQVFRQDPKRMLVSQEEHAALFRAIQAGEAERAVELVREHLECGKQFLISA